MDKSKNLKWLLWGSQASTISAVFLVALFIYGLISLFFLDGLIPESDLGKLSFFMLVLLNAIFFFVVAIAFSNLGTLANSTILKTGSILLIPSLLLPFLFPLAVIIMLIGLFSLKNIHSSLKTLKILLVLFLVLPPIALIVSIFLIAVGFSAQGQGAFFLGIFFPLLTGIGMNVIILFYLSHFFKKMYEVFSQTANPNLGSLVTPDFNGSIL